MSDNLFLYESLDSTMDEASHLLDKDFNRFKNSMILAKQQLRGRGRQGRPWVTSEGNLMMSMIVEDIQPPRLSEYALLWGLTLYEALSSFVGDLAKVQCKWPNDILINEKKVGGILIERYQSGEASALIVGIGVNIIHFPEEVQFPATSLEEIGCGNITPQDLAMKISDCHTVLRKKWETRGFDGIRDKWLEVAWRLKEEINISQEKKSVIGIFEGIDLKGALEIKDFEGVIHKLYTGDVFESFIC